MTAEGWDGKSIRQHVEHAEAEAARAIEIAEGIEERLGKLRRDLIALTKLSAQPLQIEALPIGAPSSGRSAADRAALFCKVKFIRREIERWQLFMVEARGVREAIAEFRRLDAELLNDIEKGAGK